jgi:drug/metabolite transporter (DMT)-like permease
VVTGLAAAFAAERPTPGQLAGVVVISAGLGTLVLAGRRTSPPSRTALIAAFGTGLTIAAYTTVDGIGVRLSGSPAGYIGWLMILESLCVPAWAATRRRQALREMPRKVIVAGLAAGALAVLAYGLVLWAQTRGQLAPVAALRETSVIFGALIATLAFKEPFGHARVVAAALVAAGILILNLA